MRTVSSTATTTTATSAAAAATASTTTTTTTTTTSTVTTTASNSLRTAAAGSLSTGTQPTARAFVSFSSAASPISSKAPPSLSTSRRDRQPNSRDSAAYRNHDTDPAILGQGVDAHTAKLLVPKLAKTGAADQWDRLQGQLRQQRQQLLPRSDFYWAATPEPHALRRQLMLQKYPREIRALMRVEPLTKYVVVLLVAVQLFSAYAFRFDGALATWQFWLAAYVVGGTVSSSLFLSIHEMTHFLAFKSRALGKAAACFANIPVVVPYCSEFKRYHADHHRFQGIDGVDADLPTRFEAALLDSFLGKLFFATFQIFFYAIRPGLTAVPRASPLRSGRSLSELFFSWYTLNVLTQLVSMSLLVRFWGVNSLLYLVVSLLLGGSIHPMAGHYIAEHYVFNEGQETYSYYGWLNIFAFNVGYHNEHHDFPNIPWTLLTKLRKIAPEFYDMPVCPSWSGVFYKFLFTPSVGLYSRVKRKDA
ncbi:fatty acid desaturase-domain-containing protein [Zopfochytrium polystomum]|nr:fatty acid desaturase-domain-containing protein [Zopfochytrium polystomum]